MPIPTALAGVSTGPLVHHVDERWTMAHAAALDDLAPVYLDTTRADGVVAHPLFPVCVEWPVIVEARGAYGRHGVSGAEVRTGVHVGHDLTIHRLIRPGDELATSLETVGVVDTDRGAMTVTRLQTVDAVGRPVASTTQHGIHLGVGAEGPDRPDRDGPAPIPGGHRMGRPEEERPIALGRGRAHIYTECARIWNPIHTDRAVALASGLPDIILHGTAHLGYGLSTVVDLAGGRPEMVRRVACRFGAMVRLPSTVTVRVWPPDDTGDGCSTVAFEVLNGDGEAAVRDGLVVLGEPEDDSPAAP